MIVQVSAPHFVAGIILDEDFVIEAAPILKWCVGKKRNYLRSYFKRKGWAAKVVAQ